jgi:hypothetical protein
MVGFRISLWFRARARAMFRLTGIFLVRVKFRAEVRF